MSAYRLQEIAEDRISEVFKFIEYRSKLLSANQKLFVSIALARNPAVPFSIAVLMVNTLGFTQFPSPTTPALRAVEAICSPNIQLIKPDQRIKLDEHFALLKALNQFSDLLAAAAFLADVSQALETAIEKLEYELLMQKLTPTIAK